MYKKVYIITALIFIANCLSAHSNPEDVVAAFGNALSSWCTTGDIRFRIEVEELCSGSKMCRVEDKMLTDYMYDVAGIKNETFCIDSYLNMFDGAKSKYSVILSNISICHRNVDVDGLPLNFVLADMNVSNDDSQSKTQKLFILRNNKITGIYSYSGQRSFRHLNASLIKGLKDAGAVRVYGFNGSHGIHGVGYSVFENSQGKYGIIDINGTVRIPCRYETIITDGSPWTKCVHTIVSDKWFYEIYDIRTGNIINGLTDFKSFSSTDEVVVVKGENNLWGYMTSQGDLITDFIFDDAETIDEGYAFIRYEGKGMILKSNLLTLFSHRVKGGQPLSLSDLIYFSDNKEYKILSGFKDGLATITNGKYGFINNAGEIIVPCVYDKVYNRLIDGMVIVRSGKYEGMLNVDGSMVIPLRYDLLYPFNNGVASAMKDGFFGYIDIHNNIVLPFNYGFLKPSTDGKTIVPARSSEVWKWGLVDIGNPYRSTYLYEFIYDELIDCNNGLFLVKSGNNYGYINERGFEEIIISYDYADVFYEELACVGVAKNGGMKYGAINREGVLVIDFEYDESFNFYDGVASIVKDGKTGVIDSFGNEYLF